VLKSSSDQATYDSEFSDLQGQLYQLSQTKFNGVELFDPSNDSTFQDASGVLQADVKSVVVSEDGTTTVDIHQSSLLASVTLVVEVTSGAITAIDSQEQAWSDANADTNDAGVDAWLADAATTDDDYVFSLAVNSGAKLQLQDLTSEAFTVALENLATLRATNGGQVSRLQYAQENLQSQTTNLQAAVGRIVDVDIATETAELAKQQILVQASASMVAQANTANNVALMLLQ
jgi:flagellin